MEIVNKKIDAIVNKSKSFIELYGKTLFDEIYAIKKELAIKIDNFNVCSDENCVKFLKCSSAYAKCCYYCEKTHGALRFSRFTDIISEEDAEFYKSSFNSFTGFRTYGKPCCLGVLGLKGLVCSSFFCQDGMLSPEQQQIVKTFIAIHVIYSDIVKHKYDKSVTNAKFVVIKEVKKDIDKGEVSLIYNSYLTIAYNRLRNEGNSQKKP